VNRRPFLPVLTVFLACCLMASGCAPAPDSAPSSRRALRFIVVTHGQAGDSFWAVVANGATRAGRDLGVEVSYQSPGRFDVVAMSQLFDAAVASAPDGLVVSIPDAEALAPGIRRAVAAGIPVVSINSGGDAAAALGVLAHVGQPEREAGAAAGERLARAGVRRALCVNHEVGNSALDLRCQGFQEALTAAGGSATVLAVTSADPTDTRERIANALAADPAVDAVFVLGVPAAPPALQAVAASSRKATIQVATFDLSTEILDAVAAGDMAFAIDQQQVLQGYLPIIFLKQYLETGAMPGGGAIIRTGPGFVTRDDAARVRSLTQQGLR
jgi:simple sugar transport system substrate-binding protein